MSRRTSSTTSGPKRWTSIFLRIGLGLSDFRSYAQDLKDTNGSVGGLRRSRKLPNQTAFARKPGCSSPRTAPQNMQIGRQKMRNFRQHTATQIFEVSIDSKDYLKVTAIARLKFDKWTWSCYAFHYERRQHRCRLSTLPSRSQVACWAALRLQRFKLLWLGIG